jgi:hypothetical protein
MASCTIAPDGSSVGTGLWNTVSAYSCDESGTRGLYLVLACSGLFKPTTTVFAISITCLMLWTAKRVVKFVDGVNCLGAEFGDREA